MSEVSLAIRTLGESKWFERLCNQLGIPVVQISDGDHNSLPAVLFAGKGEAEKAKYEIEKSPSIMGLICGHSTLAELTGESVKLTRAAQFRQNEYGDLLKSACDVWSLTGAGLQLKGCHFTPEKIEIEGSGTAIGRYQGLPVLSFTWQLSEPQEPKGWATDYWEESDGSFSFTEASPPVDFGAVRRIFFRAARFLPPASSASCPRELEA